MSSVSPGFSAATRASTYIVIAAFNETVTIADVVEDVRECWPHVVVVDDGSSDETASAAHDAGATVVRHPLNRGQGAALQTGFDYALAAGAEVIVTFDADGQHASREIERLVEPIASGTHDVVLGSRFLEAGGEVPLVRRLMLKGAIVFTRLASGLRLTDTHNGFRALSRKAATLIDLRADRMAHASEILDQIARHQLSYTEVPVHVRYTRHSRAKGQSSLDAFRVLLDYLLARIFN